MPDDAFYLYELPERTECLDKHFSLIGRVIFFAAQIEDKLRQIARIIALNNITSDMNAKNINDLINKAFLKATDHIYKKPSKNIVKLMTKKIGKAFEKRGIDADAIKYLNEDLKDILFNGINARNKIIHEYIHIATKYDFFQESDIPEMHSKVLIGILCEDIDKIIVANYALSSILASAGKSATLDLDSYKANVKKWICELE
ncbi:hypothetical protein [Thermopetrobacter sp. TC1]|uniref:hypothetical protein n=1 Tax=Thermopetrobacter sp. TC1 TaxID=1495045 RepID=UPI0012E01649|nr:hypothetical protein [Thermopetrobacter sp. TC1]